MRRATGSFAAKRRQFQRHADALGIRHSWLFPGNYPNPETTQMRGSPVIQGWIKTNDFSRSSPEFGLRKAQAATGSALFGVCRDTNSQATR